MSIQYVDVDCDGIFAPGQLAVAVGRAVCESGCRVRNFNEHHVIPHPACVESFYSSFHHETPHSDKLCCFNPYTPQDAQLHEPLVPIAIDRVEVNMVQEVSDDLIQMDDDM